jgi:predicted PurR-regulated permease PerM
VISFIFVIVGGIASQLPSLLISLVLFLFCVFYILYDWDSLVLNLKKFIPFKNKEKISNDIAHATHGIIYGHILVSFIDFAVTAIVLYLIGIKFSLVIAFLVAVATFIPPIGTSLIFAPLVIYLAMTGDFTNFIYVIILWFALGALVDTYLSTKILAGRAKIHPVIMILGVLGGTSVFGIFGFIIGPLILVYTIKMIEGLLDQI